MAEWTCRCAAKNADGCRYCEGCGAENPKAPRPLSVAPKLPETQQPWTAPTYPAVQPGDDVLIRAELAKLKATAWWRETLGCGPIPAVDPAIRDEVTRRNASGPEPVGALVGRVLRRR